MRTTLSIAFGASLLLACSTQVQPSNPYDPNTLPSSQAPAKVRGVISAPTLSSAAGVALTLSANNKVVRQGAPATDGSFVFDQLQPGSYVLQASQEGFVPLSLPISLQAGEDVDLGTLPLPPLAQVSTLLGVVTLAGESDSSGILVDAVGRSYTTVTDASGAYRLTLTAGTYSLRFSHKDFISQTKDAVTVGVGQTVSVLPLALPANPATLAGHVDGESAAGGKAPLGGATVTLEGTSLTGLTSASGDFTLTGIPAGSYQVRVVSLPTYEEETQAVLNLAGGESRTLSDAFLLPLARGGISGSVTLGGLSDASGIVVRVVGTTLSQITGPSGAFEFEGLPVGPYAVTAQMPGFVSQTLATTITVARGAVNAIGSFALAPNPASIGGDVEGELPAGGYAPLAGATVSLEGTTIPAAISGPSGDFTVTGVPPGSYLVRAHAAGYEDRTASALNLTGGEARQLPAGAFTLALSRGSIGGAYQLAGVASGGWSGVVVTASGNGFSGSAVTDGAGNFVIAGVPLGSGYSVTASKPPDWTASVTSGQSVATGGSTTTAAGSPIALTPVARSSVSGVVTLEGAGGSGNGGTLVTLSGADFTGAAVSRNTTTAASPGDGSYSFTSLVSGSYTISFQHAGYGAGTPSPVSVASASTASLGTTTLAITLGGLVGVFQLSGLSSGSWAGVSVSLTGTGTVGLVYGATAVTDGNGNFSFSGVPLGTSYSVTSSKAPDWTSSTPVTGVTITAGAAGTLTGSPIALSPVASSSISGVVTLESQASGSWNGTLVTLTGTDFRGTAVTGVAQVTTPGSGAYSFSGLIAGSYSMAFSHTGYEPGPGAGVSVGSASSTSVASIKLALSRGGVTGTVAATGAGVNQSGSEVVVSGPAGASAVTDSNGAFTITNLPVGSYTAIAQRTGYTANTPIPFTVSANTTFTLTPAIAISPGTGASIAGVATLQRTAADNSGISVSYSGIDLNGAQVGISGAATTNATGNFTISSLVQGTYALTFTKAKYDPMVVSGVAVAPGLVITLTAAQQPVLPVSTGSIAGGVTLSSTGIAGFSLGADYSGVVVTLTGTDVPIPAAVTDASGNYRFTSVPVSLAGTSFTVGASKPSFVSATTPVAGVANATVTPSTLTLNVNSGTLGGTAQLFDNVDGGGVNGTSLNVPIAVAGTAFNGASFSASGSTSTAGGAWSIGPLPPGSYQAIATSANRSCGSYAAASVPPGGAVAAGSVRCTDALAPGALALGAPNVSAGAQPGYTSSIGGTTVTVPVQSGATDATSPASNFRGYQVTTGEAPDWSTATILAGTPAQLTFSGLPADARTVLWARAIDWTNNGGPATSAVIITDSSAPPAPAINTPAAIVAAAIASVTLSGSESDTNFFGYQACWTTGAATSACSSSPGCTFAPTSATFALPLSANLATCLYAKAIDRAGNASAPASLRLISDTSPPTPPGFSPAYDPYKLSVRAPWVDFFSTAAATDAPGAGGPWQGIAWIELDTGAGFQRLCPQAACSASGAWNPCNCGCTDARLLCDAGSFTGVRATLTEGTATTVAFRAVDLAGNTGAGVSQQVFSDAAAGVLSAVSLFSGYPTIRGTLVGYDLAAYQGAGAGEGWLLDLGPNRRADPGDARCMVAPGVSTFHSHSVVPVNARLITWANFNNVFIRRPEPDGAWCVADTTTTLYSPEVWGDPPANTQFLGITGSGERLAWSEQDDSANETSLMVAEPASPAGAIGSATDVRTKLGTFDHVGSVVMGGKVIAARVANCGSSCYNYSWRLFSTASTFASGAVAFDPGVSSEPIGFSLSGDGAELAYTDSTGIVVRQAGLDGLFGTADDVTVRRAPGWPVGGTSLAIDGPNVVAYSTSPEGAYSLVHWSAGADGAWGTADDSIDNGYPTGILRRSLSLSDGLFAFSSGQDLLDVDFSILRWEKTPALSIPTTDSLRTAGPLAANGAGTLFYTVSDPNTDLRLVARTASGAETSMPVATPDLDADPTQLLLHDQRSSPTGLYVYLPDSSGRYLTAGSTPVRIYSEVGGIQTFALGEGKVIAQEYAVTDASACQGASGSIPVCAVYEIFDPGMGSTLAAAGSSMVPFNPYPGYPGLVGVSNPNGRPAINARQAFFNCGPNYGLYNVCVYGAGPDGTFGTGDDVPAAYLHHPVGTRTGSPFVQALYLVSGNRMLITEQYNYGLYLLDAGPDGLFNTADDSERLLAAPYLDFNKMWLSGDWAAWLDTGGPGGEQVYSVSGFDGPVTMLTDHYSSKRSVRVDRFGRTFWVDGIFNPEGIMVRAP